MRFIRYFILLGLLGNAVSCSNEKLNKAKSELPLFIMEQAEHTGIDFRNDLPESIYNNGLFYEYFYNGAGVAVADFNNDNLDDIYFVSNLSDNQLYINKGGLKFENVTSKSKVQGKSSFSLGVTTVDINADGLMDIYVCASGQFKDPTKRRNELLINMGVDENGIPKFTEQGEKYGLDLENLSTQASFFDYDKDGDLDMFLINHNIVIYQEKKIEEKLNSATKLSGERLYRNDNGRFVNVSKASGLIDNQLSYGLGLSIGDLNNDSWPDVYVGHDFGGRDHMYINNKDGSFRETIVESTGHISNFSMGNDIADINNDGWQDVMTVDMVSEDNFGIKTSMSGMEPERFQKHVDLGQHYQYMFNALQLNNGSDSLGTPYFSEIAHIAGVSNTDWSWGPLFFDMDNNGNKDLFVSNGIKRDFRNNDFIRYHRTFREEVFEKGKVDEKEYISTMLENMPHKKKKNYFYLNKGDLKFEKDTVLWNSEKLTSSNGAAYADFDNDGDMDLVVNNMDDLAYIYRNTSSDQKRGNYLKIRFEGDNANTKGIGARVWVTSDSITQSQENYLTRGFQSSVPPNLLFGLENARTVDELVVQWADGSVEILNDIPVNRTLELQHSKADNKTTIPRVAMDTVLFEDITRAIGLDHSHKENNFDDYERESLLPHKMSQEGPALAVGDINNDGLEDFFVGGAMTLPASLYLQDSTGRFHKHQQSFWNREKMYEDVAATFFDADGDSDLDLYVCSGGNEMEIGSKLYQDRLYINKNGTFKPSNSLPKMPVSSSCARPDDFDNDGDLDLFVGGRQEPGKYPYPTSSFLLENVGNENNVSFRNVTKKHAPILEQIGMVTDAKWADIDGNGSSDLVLVGEWMPITILKNEGNSFVDVTKQKGLSEQNGWWNTIVTMDLDQDGDMDIIAGNLGLNYKYRATKDAPFSIYAKDFDNNKSIDIVLGYFHEGNSYPLRGRECSSNQMPFIKEKFPTYKSFGEATLMDVYGRENLKGATHYEATNFASTIFENHQGKFLARPLTNLAQISSINAILIRDFDKDNTLDMVVAGNRYGSEIETPRNDASYGTFLKGNKKGSFAINTLPENGLRISGETKDMQNITIAGDEAIIIAKNNAEIQVLRYR